MSTTKQRSIFEMLAISRHSNSSSAASIPGPSRLEEDTDSPIPESLKQ